MTSRMPLNRREWLARAGVAVALMLTPRGRLFAIAPGAPARAVMDVRKTVGCNCCEKWAARLRAAGYVVNIAEDADLQGYKDRLGVPAHLRSCHTGLSAGYLFEGHVPVDLVDRMLAERPKAVGLAVPGMPAGAPGMESTTPEPYYVIAFASDGRAWTYARRG